MVHACPCCFIPLVLACLGAAVTVLFACAQAQMILAFDNETCRGVIAKNLSWRLCFIIYIYMCVCVILYDYI